MQIDRNPCAQTVLETLLVAKVHPIPIFTSLIQQAASVYPGGSAMALSTLAPVVLVPQVNKHAMDA